MRASTVKWLVGVVLFFLPTVTMMVGTSNRLNYTDAFRISMLVAAIAPPALVLTSSTKWRVALALGVLLLLGIQYGLILLYLLAGFRD